MVFHGLPGDKETDECETPTSESREMLQRLIQREWTSNEVHPTKVANAPILRIDEMPAGRHVRIPPVVSRGHGMEQIPR